MTIFCSVCSQPVQPQYYYGSNFGYIIAFKPHDSNQWHRVTIADPRANRYIHKDPSIPPATKFDVKIKAFNSMGEGPYSQTAFIYSAQDGEYQKQILFIHNLDSAVCFPKP